MGGGGLDTRMPFRGNARRGDTVIWREGGRGRGLVDWSPDGRGAGRIMWGGGVQSKELLVAQGFGV